jgi:hypothetical protein
MMMTKLKLVAVALLVVGAVGLAAAVDAGVPVAPAGKAAEDKTKTEQDLAAIVLQGRLNKPIGKEIQFDSNTPLKEALGFLSDTFDFSIVIDDAAFKAADAQSDVGNYPVRLAKMHARVSMRTVLRMLLDQVPDATFFIRKDFVEVTTLQRLQRDYLRAEAEPGRLWQPLVHAVFEQRPLRDALRELSDVSDVNIVLDPRVGDNARTEVTARFSNVAVDTAVRLLAAMADLKPVRIDNVIFVTTPANAEALQAEQSKRKPVEPQPEKKELPAAEKTAPLPGGEKAKS